MSFDVLECITDLLVDYRAETDLETARQLFHEAIGAMNVLYYGFRNGSVSAEVYMKLSELWDNEFLPEFVRLSRRFDV